MGELEATLLDDVHSLLDRWRVEYVGDRDAERETPVRAASLPTAAELDADLERAGFEIVDHHALVPTEPFVGIRARPGTASEA